MRDVEVVGAAPAAVPNQLLVDTYNLYYNGGCVMQVDHINRDADTSVSMRARNYADVTHRFFDSLDTLYTDTNLGFQVPFSPTTSATAVHSGSTWQTAYTPDPALIGTGAQQKCYVAKAFQHAWQSGFPFVQLKCKTTAANIAVDFSVSLHNWIGVAPFLLKTAGAMPLETVPFSLPSWWRIMRSASVLKGGDAATSRMFTDSVASLQREVTSTTPLMRAVATSPQPAKDILKLAQAPAVAMHNPSLLQRLSGGLNEVKGFAKAIGGVYREVSPWLAKAMRSVSTVPRQLAPYVGATIEAIEDAAPLMIMAA
jgi:hypothetical protein